ncbi:MAG: aminotransferase class V-fold PLP-dependent enzyme [bacterium]|nr:aminotransferase class V-fold PLP-dependent enzyme [bacterium]
MIRTMGDFRDDFGPFDGKVWLNCSHQGALPRVAAEAAAEAVRWKRSPFELTTERFTETPRRLRRAIATLIGARMEDVVLANSASYGLHLLANGFPWREGDEVLLVEGDFPSDILPWLGLEKRGVAVRFLKPRRHVPEADEVLAHITPRTRLFCTTWVHSFSGWSIDLDGVGSLCRERGVKLFINASQAVGSRPLDVSARPVDAVTSAGFKYLCGPYGTGFLWMREDLRESLEYNQAYWLSMQTADELGRAPARPKVRDDLDARRYDIFGTANFFNYKPWTASIEYLLDKGIDRIAAYDQQLVSRVIEGLEAAGFSVLSPREGKRRSNLVFFTHREPDRNKTIYENLRRHDIYTSFRQGNLRISPHLFNTDEDVDRALSVLSE